MDADVTSAPLGAPPVEPPVAPQPGDPFLRIVPAAPPVPVPPQAQPPKRTIFVSRRIFDGLHPRPPKVPTTAADSLALRAAEMKRRRKAAARREQLLAEGKLVLVKSAPARQEPYEPMAPTEAFAPDMPSPDTKGDA